LGNYILRFDSRWDRQRAEIVKFLECFQKVFAALVVEDYEMAVADTFDLIRVVFVF
jgi:hypothetical protein